MEFVGSRVFLQDDCFGCKLIYGRRFLQKYKLRVFENRVLRRVFGPKRKKVVGGWRGLHNEELHNWYT
jgi:hypothetical protein